MEKKAGLYGYTYDFFGDYEIIDVDYNLYIHKYLLENHSTK